MIWGRMILNQSGKLPWLAVMMSVKGAKIQLVNIPGREMVTERIRQTVWKGGFELDVTHVYGSS